MQQQYADETMKQQIFKIHQENTKIESTIILTNITMASEPPVEEVLVALSLTADTKTKSGVMEQHQNTMNDEDEDNVDVITPA